MQQFKAVILFLIVIGEFAQSSGDLIPSFKKMASIQASASKPWPSETEEDNLCEMIKHRELRVTIVMGSDRAYADRMVRCLKNDEDPVGFNARYADAHNYSLRFYIDEDIPFVLKHGKNALMGELRKIVGLADALRPSGPQFGIWKTKAETIRPDLVMWVDGDAHITGLHKDPISLNELIRRSCERAEYPTNYARIIAQDSGNNVNAGWYVIGGGSFGSHFLKYVLELFEIYSPCGMWGQNLIQEALLIVMAGTPPPWNLVLPCSGEKYRCFNNETYERISHECHRDQDCILSHASAYTNATKQHLLDGKTSTLNGCFSFAKYELAPNAEANYKRGSDALAQNPRCDARKESCCDGFFNFASTACNGGGRRTEGQSTHMWGASGAGVILLPEKDEKVRFNSIRQFTLLLWHHGHNRILPETCK